FALMPELDPDLLIAYRYLSNDHACRGLDARLLATLVYETPESRPHLSLDLSPVSPLVHYRLLELDESFGHEPLLYRRIQPPPLPALPPEALTAALRVRLREARLLAAVPVIPELDDALASIGRREELPAFIGTLCREYPGVIVFIFIGDIFLCIEHRSAVYIE